MTALAQRAPASARDLRRTVRVVGVWLAFAALAVSTLYPLVFLTLTALRPNADYARNPAGLPGEWTLQHVTDAFSRADMGRYAVNSLIVVTAAVVLLVAISCLAAYALTLFEFPLRRTILVIVVAMMALPPTVLMIPIFKVVLDLGMLNQRHGLVLVYTSLNLPFSVYLLTSYMRSIPRELLNAASIDGAGPLRMLWSVVVPLVRPGLLTLVTLNFLFLWNELLFSLLILPDENMRTIMVGISATQGQYQTEIGVLAAGLLLSMIPPLLIFALFQRDLARGLAAGAVK
ncbi:MAG TPA: carbohydrate ABC transporter permease [Conexibacter sp.]|nr:carbohydrate ABC transporter permease [Conexibacter sp.]